MIHASTSGDETLETAATWYYLKSSDVIPEFALYEDFLARHRGWPEEEKLITRAEIALLNSIAPQGIRLDWFKRYPPRTARGKFYVLLNSGQMSAQMLRPLWIEGDFKDDEENFILRNYGGLLDISTHIQRVDRLLWEGQVSAAQRLLGRLPDANRRVAEARIGLIRKAPNIEGLLRKVPASHARDPGLLYERAKWRFNKKLYDGVSELLLQAPANPPYPAKWWPMRSYMIREMQQENRYDLAYTLAKNHGQVSKIERSEALWMLGWTAFAYKNDLETARSAFSEMYKLVEYPVSKSRAAYWRGRTAKAGGDSVAAANWFRKAARYPTTFYGQLAQEELSPGHPLALPAFVRAQPGSGDTVLARSEIARAAQRLVAYGGDDLALPLFLHVARQASTPADAAAVADLGLRMGRKDFAVRAAKEALNRNIYLAELYPLGLPQGQIFGDKLLVLSIMRQESMFNPRAQSSANAIGLMQMLPSTAKREAKKLGLGFTPSRLYEPTYNAQVGSFHLQELVSNFGGSYAMAAAGYNAGPGKPSEWRYRFGDPRRSPYDAIQWTESIPYGETRNYVQRIMENYQVYRALISSGKASLTANEVLGY
ncbi:MAG: lytic transglycosylase domain-containing protein [Rickettsiales bacterium]